MKITLQTKDILILDCFYRKGSLANQELAAILNLSPSTISNVLKRLATLNLIREFDSKIYIKKNRKKERNKKTYHLNPLYGYALAIEIDYDFLNIFKLRFDLSIEYSRKVPVSTNTKDSILRQIDRELDRALEESVGEELLGVGFGLPGKVNIEEAVSVFNTRMKDWRNVQFDRFSKRCNHIVLENIANCKAIGERIYRQDQNIDNFLFLNIGNGVGMGIFINGSIYRGYNDAAGNAGHTILNEESDNICICGNKGCLESFVSNKAICNQLSKLNRNEVESEIFADSDFGDPEKIYKVLDRHYQKGDKVAFQIINEIAHKIGLACANFFQLFAPEYIFIGGEICDLGEYFLKLIIQNVQKYYLPWNQQINIAYSKNSNFVGACGLGLLAFRAGLGIHGVNRIHGVRL